MDSNVDAEGHGLRREANKMRTTKINISPAMREFNEAVETADALTDYKCDTYSAMELLIKLENTGGFPENTNALANAMAGIAVKR